MIVGLSEETPNQNNLTKILTHYSIHKTQISAIDTPNKDIKSDLDSTNMTFDISNVSLTP